MIFELLVTVAGAVIGAGVGWVFAWDLLGETVRLLLAFGTGGAVAGLLLALYGRQRIAPMLGVRHAETLVAVFGAIAIAAAARLTGYVFLFASGAAPWWPFALCMVVLTTAASLAAVVCIGLAALIMRALSRSEPRTDPKVWRRRILGEGAGALIVLGFMVYMPEDGYRSLWFMLQEPRRSPWHEARQSLFSDVLANQRCDLLVAPVDAGLRSLDRPARTAIAHMLSVEGAERVGGCAANPDLVHRALGEHLRRFDDADVRALATRTGAMRLIRTEVTLTPDGKRFTLALREETRAADGPWSPGAVARAVIAMPDDDAPERAAWQSLPALLDRLGIAAAKPDLPARPSEPDGALPDDPLELAGGTRSVLDAAARLQLLALFAPEDAPEARLLWLRSLIALRHADPGDARVTTLAARAWLHLGRRVLAERLATPLNTAEGRVVLALSRGDLPGAQEASQEVNVPLTRLIDRIGVGRLEKAYGKDGGAAERRARLLETLPGYLPYVHHALGTEDWDHDEEIFAIADEVQRLGITSAWIDARTRLLLAASRTGWLVWLPRLQPTRAGTTEMLFAPAWKMNATAWRSAPIDRVTQRDLAEVLFAINRAAMVANLYTRGWNQALYGQAFAEANALEPALRRNPAIVLEATWSARWRGHPEPDWLDALLRGGALEIARRQLAFEDAYTPLGQAASYRHGLPIAWSDEPMSAEQVAVRAAAVYDQAVRRPESADLFDQAASRSTTRFDFAKAAAETRSPGNLQEARERFLASLGPRFRGHFSRTSLENEMVAGWGDPARELAYYERQIGAGATEWNTYYSAALALMRLKRPHDARRMGERWPGFQPGAKGPVTQVNDLHALHRLFVDAGETAIARSLAEQVLTYRTGAGSEFDAAQYLAASDRDWAAAAGIARDEYRRYDNSSSLADAAWFGLLAGAGSVDADLATLRRVARTIASCRVHVAQLRMAGADRDAIRNAIAGWSFPGATEADQDGMRSAAAVEALLVDRVPSAEDIDIIRQAAGSTLQKRAVTSQGYIASRAGDHETALRLLRPVLDGPGARGKIRSTGKALPLVARSLVATGRVEELRARLADLRRAALVDTYTHLATAWLAHADGQPDAARQALWEALLAADDYTAPTPMTYLVLETAEDLFRETGDARYRETLTDFAGRASRAWPWSWAYAFLALHAETPSARAEAAAAAMRLDPRSARLAQVPAAILEDARTRYGDRNPAMPASR